MHRYVSNRDIPFDLLSYIYTRINLSSSAAGAGPGEERQGLRGGQPLARVQLQGAVEDLPQELDGGLEVGRGLGRQLGRE